MSPKWKLPFKNSTPVSDSLQGRGDAESPSEKDFFRKSLRIILGLLLLMFLSFIITFFVAVRGAEQTLVPDVTGELLIDGLIDLQDKELYPRIQVRFTEDPLEKDHIIAQDPQPGSVVRAGRRVKLTVSKGAVVDKVGDYVGQNLVDVKTQLQTLFASYKPLLIIREPVIYVYDDSPAGTILEQKPEAGMQISGLTELELIVSRGPVGERYVIDDFSGLKWQDALNRLVRSDQPFVFKIDEEAKDGSVSTVTGQVPKAGNSVLRGTPIELTISTPSKLGRDERFGTFEIALPDYPISVDLVIEKELSGGKTETLLEMKHPGGTFSIPYREPAGTVLNLKVYDEKVRPFVVQ